MNQTTGVMILAGALALAYAGSAAADIQAGFYGGVGIGQNTFDDNGGFDQDDTGFKLFGGYQVNDFFAVELAYIDGGAPSDSVTDDGSITGIPGTLVKFKVETDQINVSALGTYAFTDFFGVIGRLGFSYLDGKLTSSANFPGFGNASASVNDNSTDFAYGAGLWLAATSNLVFRLEYEMTKPGLNDIAGDDIDLSLISLSALYKFAL